MWTTVRSFTSVDKMVFAKARRRYKSFITVITAIGPFSRVRAQMPSKIRVAWIFLVTESTRIGLLTGMYAEV